MVVDFSFCRVKKKNEASVCLCGSQVCRGSYLNLTGEGAFQKIQTRIEFSFQKIIEISYYCTF